MLDISRCCPFVLSGVVVLGDGFHRSGHWAALGVGDKAINFPANVAPVTKLQQFFVCYVVNFYTHFSFSLRRHPRVDANLRICDQD
jgi:hypothetical protein